MKVVLHLAVSNDGFIAKKDGDSNWVSPTDEALFKERARELGALVVGKTTYQQYKGSIYPVAGAINIVLTREHIQDEGVVTAQTVEDVLHIALNHRVGLLVAGGARTARAFLDQGVVTDVYLSVHPLRLGTGIEAPRLPNTYRLVGEKELPEGIVEKHFAMI